MLFKSIREKDNSKCSNQVKGQFSPFTNLLYLYFSFNSLLREKKNSVERTYLSNSSCKIHLRWTFYKYVITKFLPFVRKTLSYSSTRLFQHLDFTGSDLVFVMRKYICCLQSHLLQLELPSPEFGVSISHAFQLHFLLFFFLNILHQGIGASNTPKCVQCQFITILIL